MERFDVVVLGAGAAGLMAGIEAARRGCRVVVIDHARAPGEKIRISGGGRCNFTNRTVAPERFLSGNPRFALSALSRYTPQDFIARLDAAGIAWHEKTLGQLFCDGLATQVVTMLTTDLARAGGELRLGCTLGAVRRGVAGFEVETAAGVLSAGSVVVATGGKSIPKMGATGHGYAIAQAFGLPLIETRPALVPLTFAVQELSWMVPLAGVALKGRVTAGPPVAQPDGSSPGRLARRGVAARPRQTFDEAVLFTHRGLSGPAILQASSYWREGEAIVIDVAPGHDLAASLQAAKAGGRRGTPRTVLAEIVPDRLARHLEAAHEAEVPLAEMSRTRIEALAGGLHRWRLVPVGSEGYRTAEVTLGGVATNALDPRTMEARGVPGLYFVGEVVDVTGWLGGYNFQWAWSSGWVAGQVA